MNKRFNVCEVVGDIELPATLMTGAAICSRFGPAVWESVQNTAPFGQSVPAFISSDQARV